MAIMQYSEFPEFVQLLNAARDRLLYLDNKNFIIWQLAKMACNLEGDFAEVGVYKGGTAFIALNAIQACHSPQKIFLFDTFCGIPYTDARDLHRQGDFSNTSLADVNNFLSSHFKKEQFFLIEGIFPGTAISMRHKLNKFAYVHIDVDVYQSSWDCLTFFYPLISPGGILLLDDYGTKSCPGAKEATDDFIRQEKKQLLYLEETEQAIIFK